MKSTIAYPLSLLILGMVTCLTIQANAQTDYDVTVGSGTGAGSLPYVIAEAAQSGNNDSVINIEVPTVSMTSQQFISVANLDIEGNGATINMNNDDRAFFVAGGDVSISNLSIEGGLALGGNGGSSGGGGAGLGGAIFVADGQSISGSGVINPTAVTLSGVNFLNNSAVGGNGASVVPYDNGGPAFAGGGGGGMGGNGGIGYQENPGLFANNYISSGGGGGGFGVGANGGNATYENAPNGNNGAFVGGAAGGGGVGDNGDTGINTVTTSGGANGGGGGGSQADGDYAIDNFNNGGGGGVAGGTAGSSASAYAGNGGFGGGGGGGGIVGRGGAGGFGGGGGGNDGAGGFGGGGGGGEAGSAAGTGGFGGGSGAVLVTGSPFVLGGGGLGAGGALYIMNGASLTIQDATFTSNSVAAGMGYNNGSAYGSDLFLGANVTFNLSNNITVNNLGGAGNNSDPNVNNDPNAQGGVIKTGAATLTLTGPSNYYSGVTTINQGTLALADSALEQGTSQVIVGQNSGDVATLALGSGSSFTAFSGTNPGIILGQQSGAVGTMTIGSGAGSSGAFLGVNQISGGTGGGQLIFNQNFAAGSSSNTTYVFATALTGNLQVVQNGLGTTLLIPSLSYGANSFNGGIVVNNGLLQLGTNTALPSGNDISVNGGAFDFNGYAPNFIGALTLNGGVLTNSAGSESVGASSITSISGIIGVSLSGNESFVQQGGGTTALTTNCTYGGDTIIHSGTLAVGKNASINGTSQVFVGYSGGDQGTLILGSGSDLGVAGFFETNDLPVILGNAYGSSGTIQIGTGAGSSGAYVSARYFLGGVKGSVIFDQAFDPEGTSSIYPFFTTLQGNLSVTQNGPGTTLLNPLYGSNSYTNSTTVNGGTLLASTGGSLGCSTNIIVNSGGILNLGASNVVSGNQQFSLNGGKVLLSANQSQNFGSWNILGNSLFDLGGTTSTLTFSAFAINGTLAIWNWNAGLETLDIPGAANALYPSVLFYSDSGTTEIGTGEILNGQLQAVPEPSSCTLIALGVLTLGIACRRRVS